MRQLALVALLCAAVGCDPSVPAQKVESRVVQSTPSVGESKADVDSLLPGFRKFVPGEIKRINAAGFTTSEKYKCEVTTTKLPATPIFAILSIDVVRKGNPAGPNEMLAQALRDKDTRTITEYRRAHNDPLATPQLATKKYTIPEIAAKTVFFIHLDMKYVPREGSWVLYRGNTQVISTQGLDDKDIALDKEVRGRRYIAWRIEDLGRLY